MIWYLLSKYRSALMGLATIWVISYHFGGVGIKVFDIVTSCGYRGVDIFFLLSGLGMAYAYKGNIKDYYKKRFYRIIPFYFLMVMADAFCSGRLHIVDILIRTFGIGYFITCLDSGFLEWYIPTQLIFYLFYPLWYNIIHKFKVAYVIVFLSVLLTLFCFLCNWNLYASLSITRLPIFLIGTLIGLYVKENKADGNLLNRISERQWIFSIISTISLPVIIYLPHFICNDLKSWHYFLLWLPLLYIIPEICIFFAGIFNKTKSFIPNILSEIGNVSLEMYLIHVIILNHYRDYIDSLVISRWLSLIVFVLAVYIVSKLIHVCYSPLVAKLVQRI